MQRGKGVEDPVSADRTSVFEIEFDIEFEGSTVDFKGAYVHGKRGDRFLYLAWGVPDSAEPFVMFARAKIKLGDLDIDLVRQAVSDGVGLVCEVAATNDRAQPASGTIKPPAASWSLQG